MKIERLINILMMLIKNGRLTASELSKSLHVSIRTIQRDIETLCAAGIPIYAEVGKNGGYQLIEQYREDNKYLNMEEGKILLSFLENIQKIEPNIESKSMLNKFITKMPEKTKKNKLILKLNPLINENDLKNKLRVLADARGHKFKVQIEYTNSELQNSNRVIHPYTIVMMRNSWFVYSYCELSQNFKMFNLSRINYYNVLKDKFDLKETPKTLPWNEQLDSVRRSTSIILEIDKSQLSKLPEYFDKDYYRIEDNKIIVNIFYPVDDWLYSLLFSFVPYIKIIKPTWLNDEFKKKLQKCLEKNIL